MAHIEPNDFSQNFDRDFRDDVTFIADRANDLIEDLDRSYGGQLQNLASDFGAHRNNFLDLLESIISNEVLRNRKSLDDVVTDAVLAAAAVCAKTIRRGTRESENWVADEFSNNPFLEDLGRNSRRDDRNSRSDRGSSRYSRESRSGTSRRTAADYRRGGSERSESRSNSRNDDRRTSRRKGNGDVVVRGRIAAITKPDVVEEQQPVKSSRVARQTSEPATSALKDGDVILSSNLAEANLNFGLLYIAGDEQVVITNNILEVNEFTGESKVDYAQHSIDRFYPDILGTGDKTELTAIAIREAEKVKDQTIKRFISDPSNVDAEQVSDPKLFHHAKSGSYEETLRFPTRCFSPIELRDSLVDEHTGTFDWFAKHALFVKAEQVISLKDITNDNVIRLKDMIDSPTVLETVGALVTISDKLDPVVWRLLHDYITVGFNKRLVSLDLNILVDSITADWNGFREWLLINRPEFAETLNIKNGILNGVQVELSDEENNLVIHRHTLFLPINSYDLDFASATASAGFAVLNEQSKVFKFVNDIMSTNIPILYITTLDAKTLAVRDMSGVMGSRYFVTKE